MFEISVGKPYYKNIPRGLDGMILEYEEGIGFSLSVIYNEFTNEELNSFRSGDYKFGLSIVNGLMFITVQLGNSICLSDVPFNFGLYEDSQELAKNLPIVDLEDKSIGIPLNMFAIDSSNRMVMGIRTIGLSTEFSYNLIEECKKQANCVNNEYDNMLKIVTSLYSSEEIDSMAKVRCDK